MATEDNRFNQQLFMTAVYRNDIPVLKDLLSTSSIDVNGILDNGKTLLVEAVASGNLDCVDILLEHNVDPNQTCPGIVQPSWGSTISTHTVVSPLQLAVKKANSSIVQRLLENGADLHKSGFSVVEILHLAIKHFSNSDALIEYLLSKLEQDSVSVSKYKNQLSVLLITAVSKRRVDWVKVLLNKGANPNHRIHGNDLPVLVVAANEGDMEVCQVLVEAGAVLNNLSYIEDVRPLTSAVEAGLTDAVSTLIKLGAEVNVCSHLNVQKVSLLHIAVARRNVPIVRLLLGAGAHIKAMGNQQVTPLHIVCQGGSDSAELMSLLLDRVDHGSDILNAKNTRGQSALLIACQNKYTECARHLIEKGADVNTLDGNGESVLMHAVRSASDICVELLVNNGAKVNYGRSIGCTPLLSAIWLGDYTLVELLLEAGANALATKEGNRESGLHLAIAAQSEDILELLLNTGKLDVDGRTDSGDTPLMLAARSSSERACELLANHGANLDLRDENQEETALSLAVYFGKEDNASLLIREGADVNIADHTGLTPLYWAFFNCRIKVLTLLILTGACITLQDLSTKYPRNLSIMQKTPLLDWIKAFLGKPRKLQDICRLKIRRTLCTVVRGKTITNRVRNLPLPERLQDYLLYSQKGDIPDFNDQPQNSDGVTLDE